MIGLDDGKAENLLIETFRRHSAAAVKQAEEKRKRFEEMDRKKRERAEMEKMKEEQEKSARFMTNLRANNVAILHSQFRVTLLEPNLS